MKEISNGLSDTELALLAKQGDAAAFEEIYDRHVSGVARVLASFAGPDRDLLDDLIQDVFFRIVKNLDSYEPVYPFPRWLYTVALNVGRNHARRTSMIVPVDPTDLESLAGASGGHAEWSRELIETTAFRLVTRLPIRFREVVSLRIGLGLSYEEIGEVLGIPAGTARSRMHTAVHTLRRKLGIGELKRENQ